MTIPLIILAVLSVLGGYISLPHFLAPVFAEPHEAHVPFLIRYLPTLVALGGIGLAYQMYVRSPGMAEQLGESLKGAYQLLLNKYYVDELYDLVVIRPMMALAHWFWQFFDVGIIDRMVNGMGETVMLNSRVWRYWQTGNTRHYALSFLIGAIVIAGYYVFQ